MIPTPVLKGVGLLVLIMSASAAIVYLIFKLFDTGRKLLARVRN